MMRSVRSGCIAAAAAMLWMACGTAAAQDQPERGDRDDPQTFYRRFLKVRNITQEKAFVFIQYRTFQKELGKWVWQPAGAPQIKNAQAIEIPPGEEVELKDLDAPLSASRARLWAQSDNLTWEKHREFDLWLVPEVQDGEHRYVAETMETFTYFLAAPQDPNADPDALTLPINAELENAQPRVVFEPPSAPGPGVQQQVVFMPEVQQVVDPLPPIVVPPLEPNIILVREADLFVARFNIDANGSFSALIGNRGPASFRGGRRWALLRSAGRSQPYRPVLEGWIDRIPPGGYFQAWGNVAALADGSRFVLAISGGDANPANDSSGIVFTAPPRADLAVSAVDLRDNIAFVTVTNLGPSEHRGGFRTLTIADQQRVMTLPQSQPVGPLAVGQSLTMQFPMRPNFAPNNRLMAALSLGDFNRSNDFSDVAIGGGGGGGGGVNPPPIGRLAEHRVSNLRVEGRDLVGDITCIEDGVRMPRQFLLSYESTGRFPRRNLVSGALDSLAVGQTQTARIALPFDPAAVSFTGTLALESARKPRETTSRFFSGGGGNPGPNPAADYDLAVVRLIVQGDRASGIIKNVGGEPYKGGGRWELSANSAVGPRVLDSGAVPALDVGQIHRVELANPIPANQRFLKLRLIHPLGAPVKDTNPNNDWRDYDLSVVPTAAQLRISEFLEAAGAVRIQFAQTPAAPAQLSGQWDYELTIGASPPVRRGAAAGLQTLPAPAGRNKATLQLFNTPTGGPRTLVDSREIQLGGGRPPGDFGKIVVANDRANGNVLAWTFNVEPSGAKLQGSWVYKLVKDGVDVPGAEGTITRAMLGREQTFNFPQGKGQVFIQWMNFLPGQTTPASDQKSRTHILGRGPRPLPTGSATSPNPPDATTLAVDEATLRIERGQLKWRFKTNPAGGQLPAGWTYRVYITSPGGSSRIAPIAVTQQMLGNEMTYAIPAGAAGSIQVEVSRARPPLSLRTAPLTLEGSQPQGGVAVDEATIRMDGAKLLWKFQTQPAGSTLQADAWTYRVIIDDNGERPSAPVTVTQQMIGTDMSFNVPEKASGTAVIELARSNPPLKVRTRPFTLFSKGGGADLAVVGATIDPATKVLTYSIKNNGPGDYAGGRSANASGAGWLRSLGPIPALKAGNTYGPKQLDLSDKINSMPANLKFSATVTISGKDSNDSNNAMRSNELTTGGGGGGGGGNMPDAPALFIKSASLNRRTNMLTVTIGNSGGAYPPTNRQVANVNYQIKVRYPRDVSFRDMGNTRDLGGIAKNGEATTRPNPIEINHLPPGAVITVELNTRDANGQVTGTFTSKTFTLP